MTFVAKLLPGEMDTLEAAIRAADFSMKAVPHARFSAKGFGVNCTLYNSGKVVVQGAGLEAFVAHHLPDHSAGLTPPEAPTLDTRVVGSDESGKGDYFGPLVVAATVMGPDEVAWLDDIKLVDSKTLRPHVIREAAKRIRETVTHEIVVIMPERYNQLYKKIGNLNRLLAWAHGAALEGALEKAEGDVKRVVVDKFCDEATLTRSFKDRTRKLPLELRPRAESNPAVAAAAILASDAFTGRMYQLSREMDLKIPKGASAAVDAAARRLVQARGASILERVAKVHFKTTNRVLGRS